MSSNIDITCEAIITRIVRYRDSKAIITILSPELGIVQLNVTAMRNKKKNFLGNISILNYVNIEATQKNTSDILNLNEIDLISALADTNDFSTYKYQCAAAELFNKLNNIPEEDFSKMFSLLLNYLSFICKIEKNQHFIFWRFIIRFANYLGYPIELDYCPLCKKRLTNDIDYSLEHNTFVCSDCAQKIYKRKFITPEISHILTLIPNIGNVINDINIENDSINQIEQLLIQHLELSLKKEINLKSLNI